jgi:hypothetical protein
MLFTLRARRPVASLMRGRIVTSLTVTAGTFFSCSSAGERNQTLFEGDDSAKQKVVEISTTCKLK